MSEWYEVNDPEDVDFSLDGKSIHILYKTNRNGNCYVEVPVDLIENILHPKIQTPPIPECEHAWIYNIPGGWKGCIKCKERRDVDNE